MKNNKILGVIPARYASTRFPGKPLVDIWGKTMIQRVYEQCANSNLFDELIVATDDDRIEKEVMRFGGKVMQTNLKHESGTDRCAEVAAKFANEYDIVVNIQGDEPFVHTNDLALLISSFENESVDIATLAANITSNEELFDANKVKVVFNNKKLALYFSRSTIPFVRGVDQTDWLSKHNFYKHLGVYAYKSSVLQQLGGLPMGKLESVEHLEQLRWLETGFAIAVQLTDNEVIAVDTPDDLKKILENESLRSTKD
jgi:3-deoxy-manno-octulosonate cytidylyltransferase (CMP-KDO synthetase)